MSNSNNTAVAVTDVRDFSKQIKAPAMQAQIRAALPKNVSLDRFSSTTVTAINHNPELLKADRQSLYNAIVKCAADGLLPDGNDAVLNIYSTNVAPAGQPKKYVQKVQYQRMVGGLLKQFVKAGINAYAVSVYENDEFEFWNDNDGQHVRHKPVTFGNRGNMIGVFAAAKTPSGISIVEPMNIEDIEKAKAASRSDTNGDHAPWKIWYDRMAQKSALHRLRRRVAIVDENAAEQLGRMDDEFDLETGEIPEPTPTPPLTPQAQEKRRPKALQNVVDADGPDSKEGSEARPDDVV